MLKKLGPTTESCPEVRHRKGDGFGVKPEASRERARFEPCKGSVQFQTRMKDDKELSDL